MSEETKKLRSPIVTVLGHVDHGKCLHPSDKVLLANRRVVEISSLIKDSLPSLKVGDYEVFMKKIPVLSLNLKGYVDSVLAESVWRIRYRGSLFKIVLNDGRFVRVTPEHPFLTYYGWVRADKIEKHDMIAVPDLVVTTDDFLCSGSCLNKKVVLRSREILFKEVRSVEVEDYDGFLYDLSVPGTQSFIANGVVVHNTTLLDKIRGTTVVSKEPGEMTQHVGASLVPASVIEKIVAPLKNIFTIKLTIPGLLFIDTPGHEAFSNLRKRGGSVADFAILVIDIMEGVKKQTLESIEILLSRRVPFVVAANKIDRIHGWRSFQDTPFTISAKNQSKQALEELDKRIYALVGQLSQVNIPSERYDRVKDFRKTIAIVPISAKSGEGLAELLAVLAGIIQRFLTHRIMFTWGPAKGVVLEVKEIPGLGHCADVIIYDGILRKGDIVVLGGYEGPVTTRVRALLMPKPLEEMRVVGEVGFTNVDEVVAAAGVRLSAPEIEKVVAGVPLQAVENEKEIEEVSKKIAEELMQVRFSKNIIGVVVKADTLGTLEAVVSMLESRGIPVRLADVGPLTRREVIEASIVAKENKYLGVILLFNVKVSPDIEELALKEGVKIFRENIIYKLIESYENWVTEEKSKEILEKALRTVFPAKLQVIPGYVFRRSNPAIVGVRVLGGVIRPGYRLMRYDGRPLGKINQIQLKGKPLQEARSGSEVAISIEGDVLVGRHFDEGDILYTDPTEKDLETFINDFKNELNNETIQLMKEIIEIKQKEDKKFGLGILVKLRSLT
ncbi:MAG: translation initiation factor IF-2 [Desulfurococcaceae archaeon TW002]